MVNEKLYETFQKATIAVLDLDPCKRDYEQAITKVAVNENYRDDDLDGFFTFINSAEKDGFMEGVAKEQYPQYRYVTLLVLVTHYRRDKNIIRMGELLRSHELWAGSNNTFRHYKLLYKLESPPQSSLERADTINEAYDDAKCEDFYDNSGYAHLFSDIVATYIENSEGEERRQLTNEWLDKAMKYVNRAIELDSDYAKYYSTKARLLSLAGKYREALHNVDIAIMREKKESNSDYAMRIGQYQIQKERIRLEQRLEESTKRAEKLKTEVAKSQRMLDKKLDTVQEAIEESAREALKTNLEFLAIFVAVVTFTITAVQMSFKFAPYFAALIITVVMGLTLAVMASFVLLLMDKTDDGKVKHNEQSGEKLKKNRQYRLGVIIIVCALLISTIAGVLLWAAS